MLNNCDIVVVGIQAWDIEIGSNCRNIALEMAKTNRVLYVNYPLDRMTVWKQRKKPMVQDRLKRMEKPALELLQEDASLWILYPKTILESITSLPSSFLFKWANRINNKRLAVRIQKAIDALGFKNFILFNDSDMFRSFYLKEQLKPRLSCYYTRDNLLAVEFWKRHGSYMEPALMAKSDLVFANSSYLAGLAKKYNTESYDVGQGCDLTLYDKKILNGIPDDLKNIPHPIIGYTGALYTLRLDMDIIQHIATSKPNWNVVLIGPEDSDFQHSNLHQLPNVYFLGNKKPDDLPAYIHSFDVAINPQKLNEVTRGNYPRKIDEYLALGKPVVATKTEAMSIFSAFCYLAETPVEYVQCIEKALQENNAQKENEREVFARSHTWENNVKAIYKQLERKLKTTKQP